MLCVCLCYPYCTVCGSMKVDRAQGRCIISAYGKQVWEFSRNDFLFIGHENNSAGACREFTHTSSVMTTTTVPSYGWWREKHIQLTPHTEELCVSNLMRRWQVCLYPNIRRVTMATCRLLDGFWGKQPTLLAWEGDCASMLFIFFFKPSPHPKGTFQKSALLHCRVFCLDVIIIFCSISTYKPLWRTPLILSMVLLLHSGAPLATDCSHHGVQENIFADPFFLLPSGCRTLPELDL